MGRIFLAVRSASLHTQRKLASPNRSLPMNSIVEIVQQYGPLFGILAAVATVLGLAFTIYKTAHDRQVKDLQRRNAELAQENERLNKEGNEALRPLVEELRKQLADKESD